MEQLEKKFAIRRITESADEDYEPALEIYRTIPHNIRIDDKAITFWLDKEEGDKFELLVFVLYLNDEIVGFTMMTYIEITRVAVIDYIALHNQFAADYTIYFPYISLLQDYIKEKHPGWRYIVSEISNEDNENFGVADHFFKKISYLEDFGKIEAKYRTPPIENKANKKSFKAFLYIKSNFDMRKIDKTDYLDIVKSIYIDYYCTWYEAWYKASSSPEKFKDYRQNLYESLDSISFSKLLFKLFKSFKVSHSPHALFTPKNKTKVIAYLVRIIINSVNLIIGGIFGSLITAVSAILIAKEKGG